MRKLDFDQKVIFIRLAFRFYKQLLRLLIESSTSSLCILLGQVPAQRLAQVACAPLTSHGTFAAAEHLSTFSITSPTLSRRNIAIESIMQTIKNSNRS